MNEGNKILILVFVVIILFLLFLCFFRFPIIVDRMSPGSEKRISKDKFALEKALKSIQEERKKDDEKANVENTNQTEDPGNMDETKYEEGNISSPHDMNQTDPDEKNTKISSNDE